MNTLSPALPLDSTGATDSTAPCTRSGSATNARYEFLAPLGTGGMATGHLARMVDESGVVRTVAIKRLHDFIADDPQNIAILVDEAYLASSIKHENVVGVIDLIEGDNGGAPSMVMEWVEGMNLATITAALAKTGRRVPVDVAVAIMCDVLAGLEAAHDAQKDGVALEIVHRDVSPQNILVGFDGRTRITDFGVAKAAWRSGQADSGAIQGKLGYMAPEQLEGKSDRRADLYAAGVVLWELLTGTRLRSAEGAQVLVQILYGLVTPPSAAEPGVAALDDVVMRALRRHPDDRYATAVEMGAILAAHVFPASSARVARFLSELVAPVVPAPTPVVSERRPVRAPSSRRASSLASRLARGRRNVRRIAA